LHHGDMGNDLDIRLRADRLFVQYLCEKTGKSASALAAGAGMASTTLNRFVSKKIKVKSTLKDMTIQKIAKGWGLDYPELAAHRKSIEEALREGRSLADIQKGRFEIVGVPGGKVKEPSVYAAFSGAARDPLMDRIMGITYEVWFNSSQRSKIELDDVAQLARLLYAHIKAETKRASPDEIKKRAADMLAAAAVGKKK
jgi:transcriptional regulator with XRE-family HTH domain